MVCNSVRVGFGMASVVPEKSTTICVTENSSDVVESSKSSKTPIPIASYSTFFQFAEKFDLILLLCGILNAATVGTMQIVLLLPFADTIELFGTFNTCGSSDSFGKIVEITYWMVGMGMVAFVCGWIYSWCFDTMQARMMIKLRKAYMLAILRQDVGWYDTSNPQELPGIIGQALVQINEGLGVKTWGAWEYIGMSVSGFGVHPATRMRFHSTARTYAYPATRACKGSWPIKNSQSPCGMQWYLCITAGT